MALASGCPFGGPLWQLWVNHTLAHALAARYQATRAVFAVCAAKENEQLRAQAVISDFRGLVTDPSTVIFLPLEELLPNLQTLTAGRAGWHDWATTLKQRYTVPTMHRPEPRPMPVTGSSESSPKVTSPSVASPSVTKSCVTSGHRQVVAWMGTSAFKDIVIAHREACGRTMSVYFRPTDKGLVRIALHPSTPCYVGFSENKSDGSHLLRPGSVVPTVAAIRQHLIAFGTWLPQVRRSSREEQGVIRWLRPILDGDLSLPQLGDGWVFLHQEWRWSTYEKCDVIAVHVPTGRLGIVEFKSTEAELPTARAQVVGYGRLWDQWAIELAPFFTKLMQAMGMAYGNTAMSQAKVEELPARLFVGVASARQGVRLWDHGSVLTK